MHDVSWQVRSFPGDMRRRYLQLRYSRLMPEAHANGLGMEMTYSESWVAFLRYQCYVYCNELAATHRFSHIGSHQPVLTSFSQNPNKHEFHRTPLAPGGRS